MNVAYFYGRFDKISGSFDLNKAKPEASTLDVTIDTIQAVQNGIDEDELSRLKSRVQTSLVMEQESSSSRSSQIAYDWIYLGRVPSRQEVLDEIHSLSCESLLKHFQEHPPRGWTLVTIGPEALEFAHAVST